MFLQQAFQSQQGKIPEAKDMIFTLAHQISFCLSCIIKCWIITIYFLSLSCRNPGRQSKQHLSINVVRAKPNTSVNQRRLPTSTIVSTTPQLWQSKRKAKVQSGYTQNVDKSSRFSSICLNVPQCEKVTCTPLLRMQKKGKPLWAFINVCETSAG